jgi:hypothetical protein
MPTLATRTSAPRTPVQALIRVRLPPILIIRTRPAIGTIALDGDTENQV